MAVIACPGCSRPVPALDALGAPPLRCEHCGHEFPLQGLTTDDGASSLPDLGGATVTPPGVDWAPPEERARFPAVPGYEIVRELARGGMGVVYLALQVGLNRLVALKVSGGGKGPTEGNPGRFRIEAEALAGLRHPHIVPIYEVGEHDGQHFFSMEYCSAGSLQDYLADGPLTPGDAAGLVETLARAVQAAHENGMVHRDLKPANILLSRREARPDRLPIASLIPKVADFGLVKRVDETGMTRTGAILGTPGYLAPEQARGEKGQVGPPADVHALGAILYACLTGVPPFRGENLFVVLEQVRDHEPVPPGRLRPGTPRDLETICLKCLRKDPAHRYASAAELAEDLGRYLRDEPVVARPVGVGERLLRWCRGRERVRDAANYLTAMATVFFLFSMGGVVVLGLGLDRPERPIEVWLTVGLDFSLFVVFLAIGLGVRRGSVRALWAGLLVGLGALVFSLAVLAGWIPFEVGGLLKDPQARSLMFTLFSAMALAGVGVIAMALAAVSGRREG
jgi:hypothetical protein